MNLDGKKADRGCMSDSKSNPTGISYCDAFLEQCHRCSKRACNTHKVEFEPKLSCIKCTPDDKNNCGVIPEGTKAIECAPITLGYKNACYIYQNGSAFTRGCISDSTHNECNSPSNPSCVTCNQSDCNRNAMPNINTISLLQLNVKMPEKRIISLQKSGRTEKNKSKRLKCYQCNGDDGCDLMDSKPSHEPKECTIESEYDQCFTYIQHDGKFD